MESPKIELPLTLRKSELSTYFILDAGEAKRVAEIPYGVPFNEKDSREFADLVVRAVNNHESLTAAMEELLLFVQRNHRDLSNIPVYMFATETLARAKAQEKLIKVKVREVNILWSEGHHDHTLGPLSFPSLAMASARMAGWSLEASKVGYDKTAFMVGWADGTEYAGRYDLHHSSERQDNPNGRVDLADHIRAHMTFYGGVHRPQRLTESEYAALIGDEAKQKAHREFLKKYDLE